MKLRAMPALLAIAFFAVAAGRAVGDLSGSAAPDFVLKSVAGENLRLSEYRGRVVMLSFWASWCGDCRSQLESLAETYTRYGSAGLEILAVSLDSRSEQVATASRAIKIDYPVLHDVGGEVGRLYDVSSMPRLVLIDRGGNVREEIQGYRRGDEQLYLERVRALLSE